MMELSTSAWIEIKASSSRIRFFASRNKEPIYRTDTDFTADVSDFNAMVNKQSKYYLSLQFTETDLQEDQKWYLLAVFGNEEEIVKETYSALIRKGCKAFGNVIRML